MNPGPVASSAQQQVEAETSTVYKLKPSSRIAWLRVPLRFAVPAAAGVLCGVLGYESALRTLKPPVVQVAAVAAVAPVVQPEANPAELERLKRESAEDSTKLEQTTAELARVQSEKRSLLQQIELVSKGAKQSASLEQSLKAATQQLQSADERITKLQANLDSERNSAIIANAALMSQQSAMAEANHKVSSLQAQLEQIRDMGAEKGIAGELIAARNLHIVDVYDTESNGSRRKAFGRVFYVEGKSLVFYAYDLPTKDKKKIEFRVWGERAGAKTVSLNLGTMRSDSSAQGRWMLTCSDPRILAKIDAVYVTADPASHPKSEPSGPKVMYAFLDSPSH
jgi:hypothetical protein